MGLVQYALILLLIGAFILLVGILFLVWFSKYSQKPATFFLPTVVSTPQANTASFELEERPEIFEPREIKISQPRSSKIQQISELGEINQESMPRNFGKKFHFTETNI